MQVYVKWPDTELYRGPYDADRDGDQYIVYNAWPEEGIFVPASEVFPLTNGWQAWTGADPTPSGKVEVLYSNGIKHKTKATGVRWTADPHFEPVIIAYRIVEPAPVPMSIIMDRSLWWLDDDNTWRCVECWDMFDGTPLYGLRGRRVDLWVARDWFTGREHKRGEDFDNE
jgi:hypothetical protein